MHTSNCQEGLSLLLDNAICNDEISSCCKHDANELTELKKVG